jgi:hypothetical protein
VVVVVGPAQGVAVEEVAVGLAHGAEPEAEGGALEGPEPREEGTHPLVLLTTGGSGGVGSGGGNNDYYDG